MASKRRKATTAELDRFIERAMRRLQLRVFQVLTFETPVATGFARAGWSPSTGAPDRSGPDKPPPGAAFESVQSIANTLFSKRSQVAEALASGYKITAGPIFIVNNVRYIIYLDDPGTSEQAPKHFVEMGIQTAVRETERELSA